MGMLHILDTGNQIMSSVIPNPQKNFPFFLPLSSSALILLFWLIPLAAKTLRREGSDAGIRGLAVILTIIEIIALLATIITPLVYGWYTKDTTGAVIIGIVPFLLTMLVVRIGLDFQFDKFLIRSILYIGSLCFIGGLEGLCAARHETKWKIVAVGLAGLWILVFLSGID